MIDLHCHILPGLDDGAKTMEDAVAMARKLVEHGYAMVIATPHVLSKLGQDHRRETIVAAVAGLNAALEAERVPLKVTSGAEYLYDRPFPQILKRNLPMATLADSNYVLLELPMLSWPEYLEYSILPGQHETPEYNKALAYLRPVIAHPERNQEVLRDWRRLQGLRENGYLFQINLASIVGMGGRQTVKVVKKLAKERLIDLIGTDGHQVDGLNAILPNCRRQVEKVIGKDLARIVLEENPRRVLADEPIETDEE